MVKICPQWTTYQTSVLMIAGTSATGTAVGMGLDKASWCDDDGDEGSTLIERGESTDASVVADGDNIDGGGIPSVIVGVCGLLMS
jgi:hypothetical protein